jgi:hypothetical protein
MRDGRRLRDRREKGDERRLYRERQSDIGNWRVFLPRLFWGRPCPCVPFAFGCSAIISPSRRSARSRGRPYARAAMPAPGTRAGAALARPRRLALAGEPLIKRDRVPGLVGKAEPDKLASVARRPKMIHNTIIEHVISFIFSTIPSSRCSSSVFNVIAKRQHYDRRRLDSDTGLLL